MATAGSSDVEIICYLKISGETYYKLKREKTEFAEALKRARALASSTVDASMHKAACGYEFEEVVEEQRVTENPAGGKTRNQLRRVIHKHVPPDTKAAQIWMSRHDPSYRPISKERSQEEHSEKTETLFWIFDQIQDVSGMRLPAEQDAAYEKKMRELGLVQSNRSSRKSSSKDGASDAHVQ